MSYEESLTWEPAGEHLSRDDMARLPPCPNGNHLIDDGNGYFPGYGLEAYLCPCCCVSCHARRLASLSTLVPGAVAHEADYPAIYVWHWKDAPQKLKELSPHGGDEDWLALCPPDYRWPPPWMDEGTAFGRCSVSEHKIPGEGWVVRIGAHA
jgi:hypothetical protein